MIQLLHIHIPKTAGKTLFEYMKINYGENQVKRYERKDVREVLENFGDFQKVLKNSPVEVLNGHIKFREICPLCLAQQPKITTFLRDPVERVISNYRFFLNRITDNPKNERQKKRQKETLMEYAGKKQLQNVMSQYLEGLDLKELYFLGLLETFEEDLHFLADKLKWEKIPEIHVNQNIKPVMDDLGITEAEREKIRRWNEKDQILYEKALKLKVQINKAT